MGAGIHSLPQAMDLIPWDSTIRQFLMSSVLKLQCKKTSICMQICRLLDTKHDSHAASDMVAEAKEAGRVWAEGTASSALDSLRHAQNPVCYDRV